MSSAQGTAASIASKNFPELERPVAAGQLPEDSTGLDVQRGEPRRGPMAGIVVRAALGLARAHGPERLRAIQRLNSRLLIDAQHHRVLRWIHVEPDDVPHLLDEQRVGRQLEGLHSVRLQAERPPDPTDRHPTQPRRARHAADTPVRLPARRRFQRSRQHPLDLRIGNGAGRPRAGLVIQSVEPLADEAAAPLPDGLLAYVQLVRDDVVRQAVPAQPDQARAPRQMRSCPHPIRPRRQHGPLGFREHQRSLRSPGSRAHRPPCQPNGQAMRFVLVSSGTGGH